jgi:hypothetical protein
MFMILSVLLMSCTEVAQRNIRTIRSEWTGGLDRHMEVYTPDGTLVRTYEGKFDIEANEYGNKVLFDVDGKRIIIYNAIVIVEEK